MNYEKKYKEALERARELQENSNGMILKKWLWGVFPELKESEDERVRKGLIKAVSGILKGNTLYGTDVTREEAIAWLEKQEEKKNTRKREIDDAYLQGICDAKHEIEKQGKRIDAGMVIEWLRYHIQVDEPKMEYNEDGQPLVESFIAHAKARCMAADEVIEKFRKDFGL